MRTTNETKCKKCGSPNRTRRAHPHATTGKSFCATRQSLLQTSAAFCARMTISRPNFTASHQLNSCTGLLPSALALTENNAGTDKTNCTHYLTQRKFKNKKCMVGCKGIVQLRNGEGGLEGSLRLILSFALISSAALKALTRPFRSCIVLSTLPF